MRVCYVCEGLCVRVWVCYVCEGVGRCEGVECVLCVLEGVCGCEGVGVECGCYVCVRVLRVCYVCEGVCVQVCVLCVLCGCGCEGVEGVVCVHEGVCVCACTCVNNCKCIAISQKYRIHSYCSTILNSQFSLLWGFKTQ